MPDYSTGKIYKILDPQNELIYIGSTTQKLCRRFCNHEHRGNGNKIVLIELCPCNSREELVKKEQDVIEQYGNLLNDRRAYQSEEQRIEYLEKYRVNNKDKLSEKHKKWYENNQDKIKLYRENNKEKVKEYNKEYYNNNKEKSNEQSKLYSENNKEYIKEYKKLYREEHKEKISEKKKEWYKNNKDKILEKRRLKITCECGCELAKGNMAEHRKSQKHIDLMNTITI